MFVQAASEGTLQDLIRALGNGAVIEAADNYGFTSLAKCARHGKLEFVKELLNRGANVNALTGRKNTPLMYAAHGGHTEVGQMTDLFFSLHA